MTRYRLYRIESCPAGSCSEGMHGCYGCNHDDTVDVATVVVVERVYHSDTADLRDLYAEATDE